jgi:hypothetical protein
MVNGLNIALKNTTSGTVYASISGRALQNNKAICLIKADGKTPYYPASPRTDASPLGADCAILLGPPGSTTTVTIPQLESARIYFSVDKPIVFRLNPGPGLVEPSVTNLSDPNINTLWGFCEFTLNEWQLYANISYVDFVSLPISMSLTNAAGNTQLVKGIPNGALETISQGLYAQQAVDGAGWDKLVVKSSLGNTVRVLSPNLGREIYNYLFNGYFERYVDVVWEKYRHASLWIDTQSEFGLVEGKVIGDKFVFGNVGSFTKPSTSDVFKCDHGPFKTDTAGMRALTPRLAAAINRSTLLSSAFEPANPADAYNYPITNHFSRIVHAANIDNRGYAFPYDDVGPSGAPDVSGSVSDPNPVLFTIMVGGDLGLLDAASRIRAENFNTNHGVLTEPTLDSGGGRNIGWIANGDWVAFNNVDFHSTGMGSVSIRVASGAPAGISGLVQVTMDSPDAAPIASFSVSNTGGWQSWVTVTGALNTRVSGTHTVYLMFASRQQQDFVNVNWFNFSR